MPAAKGKSRTPSLKRRAAGVGAALSYPFLSVLASTLTYKESKKRAA
jgi:hypothetical protein